MTLVGGPYNAREVADIGTTRQKMPVYRTLPSGKVESGYAIYEPDSWRVQSFWLENIWDGSTLEEAG